MGARTFTTFVANVERNIGARTDLNTQVGEAVNQAHIDILTYNIPLPGGSFMQPIKFAYGLHSSGTITVASSNLSFALTSVSGISSAANVLGIYAFRDTTNTRIISGPKDYRDILEKDVSVTGTPKEYARYGNSIYFDVTTDASTAYTLYYYSRPSTMSGSNVTELPAEYDFPVECRATSIMFETPLQEYDKSAAYDALCSNWFARRINPEALAAEDLDFGLVPTHNSRSNTNQSYLRRKRFW